MATYRLADTFKDRVDKKYACFWPESIACDYVKTKRWGRDLSALLAAVRRHEAARAVDRPAPTDVVWHLRLGDTSGCERPFHNQACAKKESHQKQKKVDVHSQYFFQKDYFKAALSRLSKKLQHVTFVYSTTHVKCLTAKRNHNDELPRSFVDRSLEYVRDASEFLRRRNYTVSERRDHHPDDDLAYMCGANVLVLGGGGFTHLAALCALHRDPAARVYGSAFVQKGFLAEAARDAGRAERSLERGSGIIDVFTGSKARTKTTPREKKGRGARRRGSESTASPSAAPGGSNRRRGSESSAPFVIAVVVGVFAAAALFRLARAARERYRRCPLDEAWAPDWAGDGETRGDLELVDARPPPDAAPRFTRERELVHLFDVDSVRSSRGRAGSDLV